MATRLSSLSFSFSLSLLFVVGTATTASVSPRVPFVKNVLKESTRNLLEEGVSTGRDVANSGKKRQLYQRRRFGGLVGRNGDGTFIKKRRDEEDDEKQMMCDEAFLNCLPNAKCSNCFGDLYTQEIDWASVTPDTPCDDVVEVLIGGGHCNDLKDSLSKADFCRTFEACALWDPEEEEEEEGLFAWNDDDEIDAEDSAPIIDCFQLKECKWKGMHESFIGDGICHDALPGCYNSVVCKYDGGDCCEDTCQSTGYVECGTDGFFCIDPNSESCDPDLARIQCNNQDPAAAEDEDLPVCKDDESMYRIVMYDSFGDGWDDTELTITPAVNHNYVKFKGGLEDGSTGVKYACLNKIPTCYHVAISGGVWGNEISWEVKPMTTGAPSIAGGGSPMDCDFAVSGDTNCQVTCTGRADTSGAANDPDYKEFKDMYECINQKCVIQVGACEKETSCSSCLDDDVAEYCYGVEPFIALVDCTLCSCTERSGSDFCETKAKPGSSQLIPTTTTTAEQASGPRPCSSTETMAGSNAVRVFAECTDFDQVGMMVSEFDESHFGDLDSFEACAHSFAKEKNHGGHTALGCMQILVKSMNAVDFDDDSNAPTEAIAALAELLYNDAKDFCDCAKTASDECPLCKSFMHFKTLLYESLDACQSLDEIDCDAWNEFAPRCKNNLIDTFGQIDFNNHNQCDYVKESCGGAGPFPAFRRLDCADEIPSSSWEFYRDYARSCLSDLPTPNPPKPQTKPTAPPVTTKKPAPTDVVEPTAPPAPPDQGQQETQKEKKPYVPPEESGSSATSASTSSYVPPEQKEEKKQYVPPEEQGKGDAGKKKTSHWFRNLVIVGLLCAGGYYWYKKRTETFSFIRYQRARNYMGGPGESEMYSSLAMDSGSNSFQPPTLPPTPDNMT